MFNLSSHGRTGKLGKVLLTAAMVTAALSGSAAAKRTTIKFWHFWGGTRIPLMNKMIANFEKKNPDIKVDHVFFDPNTRVQKFLSTVVAGSPPDVVMLGRQDIPAFVTRRVLRPIDDLMKKDRVNSDIFYKSEFAHCLYQGKTWMLPIPTGGALHLLFYNKGIFKEIGIDPNRPPTTWAEMETYSRKAMQTGPGGVLKRVGYIPGINKDSFKPYLYSNRGEWISADGRKSLLDSPQAIETLKWMTEFYNKVYGTARFSVADAWNKGAQSMMLDGSWQIFYMVAAKAKIDYGIGLIPHNEGAESHGTIDGGWGYSIPGNSKHPQESWKLIKYLATEPEAAGWFYREQMRPSPLRKVNSDPFFRENVTNWENIEKAMDADIALPITPVTPDLDQVLTDMINSVTAKKRGPDAAIKWGHSESQKILNTYWAKAGKK